MILDLRASEALGFEQSVDEVDHQPGSHEGSERIVENHLESLPYSRSQA